jgi:thiol-disulfide isomerase/thioredoxin
MKTRMMIAALVSLAIGSVASTARAQEGIAVGAEAPSAAVETLDGMKTDLSRYYGDKPVVLEFWATWCPLCKKLEPQLQAARQKYAGKVTFVGVGVSPNQTPEAQREFIMKAHMAGEYVFDRSDAAQKAFAAPHTSYIVVIGKDRKVVYTGVGPEQDIDAAVRKAMM